MNTPHPYYRAEEQHRGRDFTHHHHRRQDTVRPVPVPVVAAAAPPRPAPNAESYFPYIPPVEVLDFEGTKPFGLHPSSISRRQSPRPYHHRQFQEIGDYHPSRFLHRRESSEVTSHFSDDEEEDDDSDNDEEGNEEEDAYASDDVAALSEASSLHSSPSCEKQLTPTNHLSSRYDAYKSAAAPPSPTNSAESLDEHIDRFARFMRSDSRRQRLQAVHIHAVSSMLPPQHISPSSSLVSAHHVRQHFHQRNVSRAPIPTEFLRHSAAVSSSSHAIVDYAEHSSFYRRRHSHSVPDHRLTNDRQAHSRSQ